MFIFEYVFIYFVVLPTDPFMANPSGNSDLDGFDTVVFDPDRWDTKVEIGSTTLNSVAGEIQIINTGAGTSGAAYIQTLQKYGKNWRISVDGRIDSCAVVSEVGVYLMLYKDSQNYVWYGPYKRVLGGIDDNAYLHIVHNGSWSEIALAGTPLDHLNNHTYTIAVVHDMIVIYYDGLYMYSLQFPEMVNYIAQLGGFASSNLDQIDARLDDFESTNDFDSMLVTVGVMCDEIGTMMTDVQTYVHLIQTELLGWSSGATYHMFNGFVTLTDTTEQFIDFLVATCGSIFKVYANFDLKQAMLDYCLVNYVGGGGGWWDMTYPARDLTTKDTWLIGWPPTVGDTVYFGMITEAWKQLDVYLEGGTANILHTYVWEGWTGAAWVVLVGGTDGTVNGGYVFGKSGRVTWTNVLVACAVSGITAYWIRARVSVAGANTNLPIATRVQGVLSSSSTGFDSNATFLGALEAKIYRKTSGVWQVAPIDFQVFTQCLLDRNMDYKSIESYDDLCIGLRLKTTPTRNVVISYKGYVETLHL